MQFHQDMYRYMTMRFAGALGQVKASLVAELVTPATYLGFRRHLWLLLIFWDQLPRERGGGALVFGDLRQPPCGALRLVAGDGGCNPGVEGEEGFL